MRRRRPKGRKIYTITTLLDKQPKIIKKDENYDLLISYFRSSPYLKSLKINKRCYSLLHDAVIKPEHLRNFYRTYQLNQEPFFPLFFIIKRNYFSQKEQKKRQKEVFITQGMLSLPEDVNAIFIHFKNLEMKYSSKGQSSLYYTVYFANTKKQIKEYQAFDRRKWYIFVKRYTDKLMIQCDKIPQEVVDRLKACFILQCPCASLVEIPPQSLIHNRYRKFSKEHHPDRGGEAAYFIELKAAKDFLLELGS